jgi:hypothetical protein
MELLKFMRTANYDKKINELEAKIEKKSTEIKNLEYSALLEPVNILGRATRYDVWSHLI